MHRTVNWLELMICTIVLYKKVSVSLLDSFYFSHLSKIACFFWAHWKRSPILRSEKKARYLRKKSHKSGFCSFKEQIICLSYPYFSSRIVIIRSILAAKIVQAPCIFVAYKSIVVFSWISPVRNYIFNRHFCLTAFFHQFWKFLAVRLFSACNCCCCNDSWKIWYNWHSLDCLQKSLGMFL